MKATAMPIGALLATENFFVPLYQRPYQWSPNHAVRLLQDVYDSHKSEEAEYFIGSVICLKRRGKERLEIVDGQQRLITITLILLQLASMIDDKDDQQELRSRVFRMVRAGASREKVIKVRVKVSEAEIAFYRDYIVRQQPMPPDKKLDDNKKVFKRNYRKVEQELKELKRVKGLSNDDLIDIAYHLLEKVHVVHILVDESVSASASVSALRLFNVLNSRGKELEVADLIKSEFLYSVGNNEMLTALVNEKWSEIERLVGTNNLNFFFEVHQISEQSNRDQAAATHSKRLHHYVCKLNHADAVTVLDEILASANNYHDILNDYDNLAASRTRFFLKSLSRNKEWLPAFMAFRSKKTADGTQKFSSAQFEEFAQLFEKVYMHGLFKSKVKGKQNAVCYHALEAINNTNREFKFNAIKRYIVMGDETSDNPILLCDNAGFKSSLAEDFYGGTANSSINKFVRLVLFRVDKDCNQKGGSLIPFPSDITVEHILPQKMSDPYWQKRFTHEQYRAWLHKLGNLTILSRGINSEAQNSSFDEKKQVYQNPEMGQENPFVMTQRLCKLGQWDVAQIKKRHKNLADQIFSLWKVKDDEYPANDFQLR